MRTSPAPLNGRDTRAGTSTSARLVVDAPTRMFHWLFALSFAGAWLSADSERWRALHVTLGYVLAALLGFRLLYGLLGPRQVSVVSLWRRVAGVADWLRSLRTARVFAAQYWRQGRNLSMALVIVAMLALVAPLVLSGHATYSEWGEWLEDVHEFFGNVFLAVVLAHLALIIAVGILERRNLALSMLTGRAPGSGPSPVRHERAWLAVVILLATLTFGVLVWPDGSSTSSVRAEKPDGRTVLEAGHDDHRKGRHGR